MDPLARTYKILGTQSALAKAIGVAPQVVNNWRRRGNVPAEYCPSIERATGGQVRCEELRPDVDWAVLRGTTLSPDDATCDPRTGDDPRAGDDPRKRDEFPDPFGGLGESRTGLDPRDSERRSMNNPTDGLPASVKEAA